MKKQYGGCKSWITEETLSVDPSQLKPVLAEEDFEKKRLFFQLNL